jgi:hypothetical protein
MKRKRVANEIIKGLNEALDAIKNDTPMKTTTYECMKDGSIKRTVAMKKPSELKSRW